MPGEDFELDITGDLIDDGEGFFKFTRTAQPAVRHQLLDNVGEWVGDPSAGRTRRGLRGRVNSQEELENEADTVEVALLVLEDEGIITDSKIEIDRDPQGRFGLKITSRDVQSGGLVTVSTLGEFGAK